MNSATDPWLIGLGAINAAMALGLVPAMTLFIGRVAFRELEETVASAFLRAAFPVYYMMLLAFSGVSAAALARPRPVDAVIMLCVFITALFARYWLMPIAHRLDDLKQTGQDVNRELMQTQGRTSFIIVAQLAALMAVVVRLAVL